jgi:hypothetical protein
VNPSANRKAIPGLAISALVLVTIAGLVGYRLGARREAAPAGVKPRGDCVDFNDAGKHTGEPGCVTGRVLRVYASRAGSTFLDFCTDYRSCPFTSVIFSSDRGKFGDLETLEGKPVEIRGSITTYQGRAEIIIRDPDQIREAE